MMITRAQNSHSNLIDSILSVCYVMESRKIEHNRKCHAQHCAAGHDVKALHEPQHNFADTVNVGC
jgi:hypothetical protein